MVKIVWHRGTIQQLCDTKKEHDWSENDEKLLIIYTVVISFKNYITIHWIEVTILTI